VENKKYRLVTRSDFDGLVCAVLLNELDLIDDITFVHPKDMQDGKIAITERDITTNLPYVPGAHLVFDHHESETVRNAGRRDVNHIIEAHAPSAARVVYNHYGGKAAFPRITDEMMAAVDQADSAQYSRDDILDPQAHLCVGPVQHDMPGFPGAPQEVKGVQCEPQVLQCRNIQRGDKDKAVAEIKGGKNVFSQGRWRVDNHKVIHIACNPEQLSDSGRRDPLGLTGLSRGTHRLKPTGMYGDNGS